jgi:tRNA uridine 5-carbamoylmethylation protein Kti12
LKKEKLELPTQLGEHNLMYELDKITNSIIESILSSQSTTMSGESIKLTQTDEKFIMPSFLSTTELNKLKNQYIKLNQLKPLNNVNEIAKGFVIYLNGNLCNEF